MIPNAERPKIAAMAKAGKTQRQIAAEYDENEIRENFTVSERVAIAEARRKEEEDEGRKRKAEGGRKGSPSKGKGGQTFTTLPKDRAETRAAKSVGMSRPTYRKGREVKKAAEQDSERFGKLEEEMNRTGKVTGVHKKLTVARPANCTDGTWPRPRPRRCADTARSR